MRHVGLLTNFSLLLGTINIKRDFILELSKSFKKIYFINSQNLRFFPKWAKKFYEEKNEKVVQKLPKNIIFINPSNTKEFEKFVKNQNLLIVNDVGKAFFALKIYFLIKKLKLKQVYIDTKGKTPITNYIPLSHPIRYLSYFFFTTLFKKLFQF